MVSYDNSPRINCYPQRSAKFQLGRVRPSTLFYGCARASELSSHLQHLPMQTSSSTCFWREWSRQFFKMQSISCYTCSLLLPGSPLLSDQLPCICPATCWKVSRFILSRNAVTSFVLDHPNGQTPTYTPFFPNSAICDLSIPSLLEMLTVSKQQKKKQMCSLKTDHTIKSSVQNCWAVLPSIHALIRTYHQDKACKR